MVTTSPHLDPKEPTCDDETCGVTASVSVEMRSKFQSAHTLTIPGIA
ncbi:hypothetical protein KOR42_42830 [Thalassoglobus neptunius]|uniref:Uncharacterized protein n=1 Tax=Thalassoglobus neptunius TaxID=1938619 RepID=A0A5C5W9Z5_9PLAN|nr:hypothetical protein KOR42_42830 [Thalassoglobus neptunius]